MLKNSRLWVSICVAGCAAIILSICWWFYKNTQTNVPDTTTGSSVTTEKTEEVTATSEPELKAEKTFDTQQLQQIVEQWGADNLSTSKKASVAVMDKDGTLLAGFKTDVSYFTASIYKLFVAYEGYRQVDAGSVNPDEIYQAGRTRAECLDAMIRSSDSPCGEKLWAELGKQNLTDIMSGYGLKNTSLVNLTTTPEDTAKLLVRVMNGEGLSEASRAAFLSSMKDQDTKYRKGLPSGFSDKVVVYNKVGWNEQLEYHDASIIELPDGRRVSIVVFTSGVGTSSIAELATLLEPVVTK